MSDTCGFGGLSGVAITALAITFVPSPTLTQKLIASLGPPVSERVSTLTARIALSAPREPPAATTCKPSTRQVLVGSGIRRCHYKVKL